MGSLAFHHLGDVEGAQSLYEESLERRTQGAQADPDGEQLKFALAVTLGQLGSVRRELRGLDEALPLLPHSLDIFTELAADNPSSEIFEKNIAFGLTRLGLLHMDKGELDAAREAFENSNYIRQRLAMEHAWSRSCQIDLGIGLGWLGTVLAMQHSSFGARARLQEAIDLFKRLHTSSPSSSLVARNLWMWMWNMALYFSEGSIGWTDVVRQMEGLRHRGMLLPIDVPFLTEARLYANGGVPARVDRAMLDLIAPPSGERAFAQPR